MGPLVGIKELKIKAAITMPPRRKLSTLDRGRALGWLQDGISVIVKRGPFWDGFSWTPL
jgi:hypothetical protein